MRCRECAAANHTLGSVSDPIAGPILPGATIGILGGGQLGRMLALAARPLGYRIVILDPDPCCPAAGVADEQVVAAYDDVDAAVRLAELSDVVTYELEHVGFAAAEAVAALCPLRPGLRALASTQDRLAERRFLESIDAPVAPWREVRTLDDLQAGVAALGAPLRLKVAVGGYDGRRQVRIARGLAAELEAAWAAVGAAGRSTGLVLEREIEFDCELSVVVATGFSGAQTAYPGVRNVHDRGVLVESVAPAPIAPEVCDAAARLACRIATALEAVGVITAELFVMGDGSLLVNELAPRVHNSGHLTIELARTSQFAQHVRAICGLPLGPTTLTAPAGAMVNLLGTGPDRDARLEGVERALGDPAVSVHVYGKRRVFERRKMGHVTAVADDPETALARARAAAAVLRWR